jgi:anti-sigma factor RsiW
MPECPYDLRDYLFDELSPAERSEVERYLEKSGEAREELQRLRLTHAALLSAPDEETPRRIAFVSDKVFEPSPTMRYWREFWAAAPRTAFGLATVLAVVFGGLWMVQPTVTADEGGWRLAFGGSNTPAVVAPEASPAAISPEQVRQVVLQALAEREEQQRAVLAEMTAGRQQGPAVSKADLERIRQDIQDLGDYSYLLGNKVDSLSRSVQAQSDLAFAGR